MGQGQLTEVLRSQGNPCGLYFFFFFWWGWEAMEMFQESRCAAELCEGKGFSGSCEHTVGLQAAGRLERNPCQIPQLHAATQGEKWLL